LLAVASLVIATTAVVAQQDPISARKALMKANSDQAKIGAAMAKGEAPFDLAKAKTIFATYAKSTEAFGDLFPPNSKTGEKANAAPKIREDMADFKAKIVKFGADTKAAAAAIKDLDSLKAQFGAVQKNCGGCHQTYRIKKS